MSAQSVNQRQISSLLFILLGQGDQRTHHSCLIKLRGDWLVAGHAHQTSQTLLPLLRGSNCAHFGYFVRSVNLESIHLLFRDPIVLSMEL